MTLAAPSTKFVVTTETGEISWDAEGNEAEAFGTFEEAEARAKELAEAAPGETIRIYRQVADVVAPVAPATTRRTPG